MLCLEDVLGRRTHILDQDRDQGLKVAPMLATLMGAELGWSDQEQARQLKRYQHVVELTRRWQSKSGQLLVI